MGPRTCLQPPNLPLRETVVAVQRRDHAYQESVQKRVGSIIVRSKLHLVVNLIYAGSVEEIH